MITKPRILACEKYDTRPPCSRYIRARSRIFPARKTGLFAVNPHPLTCPNFSAYLEPRSRPYQVLVWKHDKGFSHKAQLSSGSNLYPLPSPGSLSFLIRLQTLDFSIKNVMNQSVFQYVVRVAKRLISGMSSYI